MRPSVLQPLWHVGGYALGAFSALLGKKYAFACTVAVEEVISEHYAEQLTKITDLDLAAKISQFRDEELAHQNISLANKAQQAPAYGIFVKTVGLLCRAAIKLAKKY